MCRVVGPRGLCRPLGEKQVSNKQPGPHALLGLLDVLGREGRAGQGRAGQGRAGRQGRAGQGRAGQGRAGQGRAGRGRAGQGRQAGQGRAGQGRAGRQGRAGQGRAGQGRQAGQGRAGQGRAGAGQAGQGRGQGRAGQAGTPAKSTDDTNGRGFGLLLYCQRQRSHSRGGVTTVLVHREALPLPHRLVETLGRGPRSEPRAPMQMVSGALGSLGFRV